SPEGSGVPLLVHGDMASDFADRLKNIWAYFRTPAGYSGSAVFHRSRPPAEPLQLIVGIVRAAAVDHAEIVPAWHVNDLIKKLPRVNFRIDAGPELVSDSR